MGLFGSNTTTQRATTVPWAGARPALKQVIGQGQKLYNQGQGFRAPPVQQWTPMSAQTKAGLGSIWGAAQGGNPLAGMSEGALSGILSGQTNDRYNQLFESAGNPHWEADVQNQVNSGMDDVSRQFSGLGRSGSVADQSALMDRAGQIRTSALANRWDQNIANQRGILGDQTQGQLNAVAAAPGAYDQRFLPGRAMGQVGAAYDDLATRQLQARTDRFNTRQQAPWNRLGALQSAVTGAANGYSSKIGTVQEPSNWLGGALGGALGGGSLFGLPGAILGGLAGGISGL